jgi:membrane-associated phospholipid phosphatase
MNSLNHAIFSFVYGAAGRSAVLDSAAVWLTSYLAYGVVLIVLLHFLTYPFVTDEPADRQLRHLRAAIEVFLSAALTTVAGWIIKALVAAPRPFVALANIHPLVHAAPYASFPSMHAAVTMALAIAVLPYHRRLGQLLVAFSFVVALSRLYVGVHFPIDIGAGLAIGFLIPKLIHRIFAPPFAKKPEEA